MPTITPPTPRGQATRADRGRAGRAWVHVDSTAVLAGMIEVIEYTPAQERTYTDMYRAAVGWTPPAAPKRKEIVRAHR